jgi:hypothetical protein
MSKGGSGAMWNMGQNETSLYFCMKQVLKLVSCKNRRMLRDVKLLQQSENIMNKYYI